MDPVHRCAPLLLSIPNSACANAVYDHAPSVRSFCGTATTLPQLVPPMSIALYSRETAFSSIASSLRVSVMA